LPAPARPPSIGDLPPIFDLAQIYQVQAAMVAQCEALRDRVALLDPPYRASRSDALGAGEIRAWRERFDTRFAALYYPWLKVVDPLRRAGALTRDIPPSGHIAGQYAHSDFQIGVHKAPANSPLIWAEDVTVLIEDALHGVLNPEGINAIRSFPGRGLRIFGARTLSSDPDWIYINVRRLLIVIAKSLFLATQWAVFEPNNFLTRAKLSLSIYTYLLTLWESGALMGAAPEQAFFVKCDDENNPPAEREQGRLICDVGVAPSKPFEFVVLRIGRTDNEFEIIENTQPVGGR
jgi:hypothetical protein